MGITDESLSLESLTNDQAAHKAIMAAHSVLLGLIETANNYDCTRYEDAVGELRDLGSDLEHQGDMIDDERDLAQYEFDSANRRARR